MAVPAPVPALSSQVVKSLRHLGTWDLAQACGREVHHFRVEARGSAVRWDPETHPALHSRTAAVAAGVAAGLPW